MIAVKKGEKRVILHPDCQRSAARLARYRTNGYEVESTDFDIEGHRRVRVQKDRQGRVLWVDINGAEIERLLAQGWHLRDENYKTKRDGFAMRVGDVDIKT